MIASLQSGMTCPGYLYAKTLHSGDPVADEYRIFFSHSKLSGLLPTIYELKQSFSWHTGHGACEPVVAMSPDGQGGVLVVRFSDDGKDAFGRSGTLRMEAFLTSEKEAMSLADGCFTAIPDEITGSFHVVPSGKSALHDSEHQAIFGKPGTFSFSTMGIVVHPQVVNIQNEETKKNSTCRSFPLWAFLTVCAVSAMAMASFLTFFPKEVKLENGRLRSNVEEMKAQIMDLSETNRLIEVALRTKDAELKKQYGENAKTIQEAQAFFRKIQKAVDDSPSFLKQADEGGQ